MNNIYYFSIQTISKSLESAISILQKTQIWSQESGITEEQILNAKLAPDMFGFAKQIQILSDNAKAIAGRLAGIEIPKMEDKEVSLEELIQRLKKTLEFIKNIPENSYQNSQNQKIILPYIPNKYQKAEDYIKNYAIPNFYFHMVVAYSILRNLGFQIGKNDYLGKLELVDL
jgi:uncharacterized protein